MDMKDIMYTNNGAIFGGTFHMIKFIRPEIKNDSKGSGYCTDTLAETKWNYNLNTKKLPE